MIVERITEYNIDPEEVAGQLHDEYQNFIMKTDNEDTWDFVFYLIETQGFDYLVEELGLEPDGRQDAVY